MGEKNKCMEISCDKLMKLRMRKLGYGHQKETSREKLNLF